MELALGDQRVVKEWCAEGERSVKSEREVFLVKFF
jgi:hypothetical protein